MELSNEWSRQNQRTNRTIDSTTWKRDAEGKANVLAKMKEDIKLYGFKTSDFKGVLATRKKRGTGVAAKKTVAKKTSK